LSRWTSDKAKQLIETQDTREKNSVMGLSQGQFMKEFKDKTFRPTERRFDGEVAKCFELYPDVPQHWRLECGT
jgi:hypothetical protein